MKLLVSFAALFVSGLLAQTTRYPGALDNDSSLFVVADNVQTTLNAAMGTADTAVVVANAAGFAPNMIATICDTTASTGKCTAWEHMFITGVSGNILTVTRGFDGTVARTHSAGRPVSIFINTAHQKVLKDAVVAIQTALGPNLSNVASSSGAPLVSSFLFAPYSCASLAQCSPGGPTGMSLIAGNNSLTLNPVPAGINGTDVGHAVYVSGGTGAAEACTINGGSAVGGQASGLVILNCANAHSGAWTVQTATGGIQEAICSLYSGGGSVTAASDVTLRANVGSCGKPAVSVIQQIGCTMSGSYTVLGGRPLNLGRHVFQTSQQNAFIQSTFAGLNTNWNALRIAVNTGNPASIEWGTGTVSVASAVSGVADYSVYGPALHGMGVQGAVNGGPNANVGVVGQCIAPVGGTTGGCWGSNFIVNLNNATNGWDIENDINIPGIPSPQPISVYGETEVSAAYQVPSADFVGVDVEKANSPGHEHYPFKIGFRSQHGAAWIGLQIEPNVFPEATTYTFATLPAPRAQRNTVYRCTDCTQTNPTTGGGTGAWVNGVTGAWWGGPQSGHTPNGYSQEIELDGYDPLTGLTGRAYIHADTGGNLILASNGEGEPNGGLIQFQLPDFTAVATVSYNGLQMGSTQNITIPGIKSTTGQLYVCVTTSGQLVSSVSPCSGTRSATRNEPRHR